MQVITNLREEMTRSRIENGTPKMIRMDDKHNIESPQSVMKPTDQPEVRRGVEQLLGGVSKICLGRRMRDRKRLLRAVAALRRAVCEAGVDVECVYVREVDDPKGQELINSDLLENTRTRRESVNGEENSESTYSVQ